MKSALENDFDYQILRKHAFGLIDPAALYDLPAGILGEPIVPVDLAASAHLMPRLLDLRTMPDDSANILLQSFYDSHTLLQPPPIRLLIETEATAEQFTRHWNRLQLASPRPEAKFWLRLHDPRVLHQLMRILTPRQQCALFGKTAAFRYWVGDEWVRIRGAEGQLAKQSTMQLGSYDGHANWDWPRIERIGIINRALDAARISTADALHREAEVAEQLIATAQNTYGLTDTIDLVEFVTRGVTTSPNFDRHPKILAMIAPAAETADDSTLQDRLALIDESIWKELRQQTGARQLGTI